MSSIFNVFAKSLLDAQKGKINIYPNGWAFGNKGTTNAQGVYCKSHVSKDGRPVSLTLGVRSTSNCPQPPSEEYPQLARGGFSVPMKVCRKCPNHISRRRRQPFPCCGLLRERAAKGPSPIEVMAGALNKAAQKAKEMLGES